MWVGNLRTYFVAFTTEAPFNVLSFSYNNKLSIFID